MAERAEVHSANARRAVNLPRSLPQRVVQHVAGAWLTRGPTAWAMRPLAALYGALAALRRAFYRWGWVATITLPVPVIVVGNLIAGGAGKTPTVMAIVRALRSRGYTPGIVSRGYGRHGDACLEVQAGMPATQVGDEPLLMRLRTGAPVFVGRDRVGAARALLQRHPAVDVIVSDDGLQHLRLGRSAQVLVFDERGVGNGWLLPAGPLRERLPVAVPARSIVLYNAKAPSTALPGEVARRSLAGAVPLPGWWRGETATTHALEALRGRPMVAAAGLARPERFFAMLTDAGLTITPLALPDHHDFATLPWQPTTADVVLTEKDAIKIDPQRTGSTRVWVAALDFEPTAAFDAALFALLPPPGTTHGNAPA